MINVNELLLSIVKWWEIEYACRIDNDENSRAMTVISKDRQFKVSITYNDEQDYYIEFYKHTGECKSSWNILYVMDGVPKDIIDSFRYIFEERVKHWVFSQLHEMTKLTPKDSTYDHQND